LIATSEFSLPRDNSESMYMKSSDDIIK